MKEVPQPYCKIIYTHRKYVRFGLRWKMHKLMVLFIDSKKVEEHIIERKRVWFWTKMPADVLVIDEFNPPTHFTSLEWFAGAALLHMAAWVSAPPLQQAEVMDKRAARSKKIKIVFGEPRAW